MPMERMTRDQAQPFTLRTVHCNTTSSSFDMSEGEAPMPERVDERMRDEVSSPRTRLRGQSLLTARMNLSSE